MRKIRKVGSEPAYKKISHAERLKIIYLHVIHAVTVNEISAEMDLKSNSIRNILKAYELCGRTNKKKY